MESTQTANAPSFDSVLAEMQENRLAIKEIRESCKEIWGIIHKEIAQDLKETERLLKESSIEFNNRMGEFNKRMGHLDNLFGEVTEYMMAPKLCEKFADLGLTFPRANRNVSIKDKINKIFIEIDYILENGEKAVLVEVKAKLTMERINGHIERLEKMRRHTDLRGDKRTFLGAIAGVVVPEDVREYALNQGLYLIEPAGENIVITSPNDKPKEW